MLYLPKEDEKYILAKAAPLLRERGKENLRQWMELQDYVVYLLCQRKEYEKAAVCMKEAEKYASESGDLYIWGRYYDMKAGLYDEMLNGAYDDTGKKEQCLIHKMLRAVDKSINCMKRAGGKEAERLVVKYTYGKIFLLIRCMPERDLKIKRLIIEMEKVLKRDGSYRMEFQFLHYMARAWYFTLCREKAEQVLYNLKRRENVRSLMADRIWTKSIIGSSRGRICCLNWGREIRPRSGLRKEKPCVRRIRRNFPL